MDNASLILQTLDRHLGQPKKLILYGRAALQLGFDQPPPAAAESKDVDAIIPLGDLETLSIDSAFWDAQQATNEELRPRGLYITHLFGADQVFLRQSWEQHLVPINRPPTRFLQLSRPATVDLILTKMMRGADPQDLEDIRFMLRHDQIPPNEIQAAFGQAVIPDVPELREAFERAKGRVRELALGLSQSR